MLLCCEALYIGVGLKNYTGQWWLSWLEGKLTKMLLFPQQSCKLSSVPTLDFDSLLSFSMCAHTLPAFLQSDLGESYNNVFHLTWIVATSNFEKMFVRIIYSVYV